MDSASMDVESGSRRGSNTTSRKSVALFEPPSILGVSRRKSKGVIREGEHEVNVSYVESEGEDSEEEAPGLLERSKGAFNEKRQRRGAFYNDDYFNWRDSLRELADKNLSEDNILKKQLNSFEADEQKVWQHKNLQRLQSTFFFFFLQLANIFFFGMIYHLVEGPNELKGCIADQHKTLSYMFQEFTTKSTEFEALDWECSEETPDQNVIKNLLDDTGLGFGAPLASTPTFTDLLNLVNKVQSEGKLYFKDNGDVDISAGACSHNWNYLGAVFFMGQSSTAVGYGGGAPATPAGKVLFTIFCIPCIMVGVFFLTSVGNGLKHLFNKLGEKINKKPLKETKENCNPGCIVKGSVIGILFFIVPAFIYWGLKGGDDEGAWDFWDSLYFHIVSTTTIGFGDFVGDYEENKMDRDLLLHSFNIILLYMGMSIFLGYLEEIFEAFKVIEKKFVQGWCFRHCSKAAEIEKIEKELEKKKSQLRQSILIGKDIIANSHKGDDGDEEARATDDHWEDWDHVGSQSGRSSSTQPRESGNMDATVGSLPTIAEQPVNSQDTTPSMRKAVIEDLSGSKDPTDVSGNKAVFEDDRLGNDNL